MRYSAHLLLFVASPLRQVLSTEMISDNFIEDQLFRVG